MTMAEKVMLAYSGGLDTSAAIKWLADKYKMGFIALTIDIGGLEGAPGHSTKGAEDRSSQGIDARYKKNVWAMRKVCSN